MFATSGYFRGVNCPYFVSGLCERPYCHFRHVKPVEDPKAPSAIRTESVGEDLGGNAIATNDGVIGVSSRPPQRQNSLLSMVGSAIQQVQRDIEKDKATLASLKICDMRHGQRKPSRQSRKSLVYKPTPVVANPTNPAAAASSGNYGRRSTVPEYNPTPIRVLKQKHKTQSKYTIQQDNVSVMEYDPALNYSTANSSKKNKINRVISSISSGTKRAIVADGEVVSKKSRLDEEEIEAKFSDDDDDDVEKVETCNSDRDSSVTSKVTQNGSEVLKSTVVAEDMDDSIDMCDGNEGLLGNKCELETTQSDNILVQCATIKQSKVIEVKDTKTGGDLNKNNTKICKNGIENTCEMDDGERKNIFDIMVQKTFDICDKASGSTCESLTNTTKSDCVTDKEKAHSDKENNTHIKNKKKTSDSVNTKPSDKHSGSSSRHKHSKHSSGASSKEGGDHIKEGSHTSKLSDTGEKNRPNSSHTSHSHSHSQNSSSSKDQHKKSHHRSLSRRDSTSSSVSDKPKCREKHKSSSSTEKCKSSTEKHKSPSSSSSLSSGDNKHRSSSSNKDKSHSTHGHNKHEHRHRSSSGHHGHKSHSSRDSGESRHKSSERKSSGDHNHKQSEEKDKSKHRSHCSDTKSRSPHKTTRESQSVEPQVSNVDLFGEDSDPEDRQTPNKNDGDKKSKVLLPNGCDSLCSTDIDMGSDGAIEISSDEDNVESDGEDLMALEMEVGDSLDNHDTYEECLKIFKDETLAKKFRNTNTKPKILQKKEDLKEDDHVTTKRVAHAASAQTALKRRIPDRPFCRPSPAQVMHNRFVELQKRAKEMEDNTPKKSGPGEVGSGGRRLSHVPSRAGSSVGGKGLGGLIKKKPKIFNTPSGSTEEPTYIGTAAKDSKRTAHVPTKAVLLKRPTIPAEFGSKIPTNVRQRYLNLLIDECLKLYPEEKDAYDRGLIEEAAVYERSSSRTVYLNVAVNAIKRLRNENSASPPSSNKSPSKNPKAVTHQFILGGRKAVSTTFTVKRCSQLSKKPEETKGAVLYKHLTDYVLTEEQLVDNGFPRLNPDLPGSVLIKEREGARKNIKSSDPNEKLCCRCGHRFFVLLNGKYVRQEECIYHWGKAFKRKVAGSIDSRYTCCQGDLNTKGCQVGKWHVYESNKRENLGGYMKTFPCSPPIDGNFGIFALDCEMVYTTGGCELARVTVVGEDMKPVYESLVQPDSEVLDCNTRFSGLTEEDLKGASASIRDVQAVLLSLFNDKSILMGHSLESDLIALKLVHNTVVDTSVVFPHRLGPPYKRGLRMLMADILQRIIQNDVGGHDSQEDAVACLELMLWKVKEDIRKGKRYS